MSLDKMMELFNKVEAIKEELKGINANEICMIIGTAFDEAILALGENPLEWMKLLAETQAEVAASQPDLYVI